MDNSFSNRVAVVTGAASGIGRATARLLAKEGAGVVVADVNAEGAYALAEELEAGGARSLGIRVDVADPAQIYAMVAGCVDHFGRIDLLVNNAADVANAIAEKDLLNVDLDEFRRQFDINVIGCVSACKAAIPIMLKQGSGAIVNVSSLAGLVGDMARPAYGASKASINLLTKGVATSYGKRGVRCNAVAPGVVIDATMRIALSASYLKMIDDNLLVSEIGSPEDLAQCIVFLLSPAARYINGQVITVDGGLSVHMPWHAQLGSVEQPDRQ